MKYYKEITLKDNRTCILKNAEPGDAEAFMQYFMLAHSQSDYLTTYPEETGRNVENTAVDLEKLALSPNETEICAFVDGCLVGSAGINMVRDRIKTRHRAEFGISIIEEYQGLGIGKQLTEACIDCAKQAGYLQLELDVVSDNEKAVALYEKEGFTEYGRNPKAFRTKEGKWQELILMRLELA